ncbi:MAG: glycosyltransferase family 39 protein [Pseudomonadota bacterium]|nr:glycosyltransferase family 39 protein [Pseudomonadota bacterium]
MTYSPPMIGYWEANSLFFTQESQLGFFNFAINPKASTGSYEYWSLDLARVIAYIFGSSLTSFRLLPLLFAIGTLLFLFLVLKELTNSRAAFLGLTILSCNPMFFIFASQNLVINQAGFFMISALYFYQSLGRSNRFIFGFIISITFCLLGYVVSRYFAVLLLTILMAQMFFSDMDSRGRFIFFGKILLGILLLLFIFSPVNIIRVFDPSLLFPQEGGSSANELAMDVPSFFRNISINVPIFLGAFIGSSEIVSDNIFDVLMAGLVAPGPLFLLVGGALGAGVLFIKGHRAVAITLSLLAVSPVLSQVWPHLLTSMSPFRLYFTMLSLSILIGGAIFLILENYPKLWIPLIILSALFFVESWREIDKSSGDFLSLVESAECSPKSFEYGFSWYCEILDPLSDQDRAFEEANKTTHGTYYSPRALSHQYASEFVVPLFRYAKVVEAAVGKNWSTDTPIIVDLGGDIFLSGQSMLQMFNFKSSLISLILRQQGVNTAYFSVYSRELSLLDSVLGLLITWVHSGQIELETLGVQKNYPLRFTRSEYVEPKVDFYGKLYELLDAHSSNRFSTYFSDKFSMQQRFYQIKGGTYAPHVLLTNGDEEVKHAIRLFPNANVLRSLE